MLCTAFALEDLEEFSELQAGELTTGDYFDYLQKPSVFAPLCNILESLPKEDIAKEVKDYVAVPLSVLSRMKNVASDIYLQLSEEKFVKVFKQEDGFSKAEEKKYRDKGVHQLFVEPGQVDVLLKSYEEQLTKLLESETESEESALETSQATTELLYSVVNAFGWKPELTTFVEKNAKVALKSLAKVKGLQDYLKKIDMEEDNYFSRHAHTVGLICLGICDVLQFDQTKVSEKLMTAAILHDITVEPGVTSHISEWNNQLWQGTPSEVPQEAIERYRSHPHEAARLIDEMKNVSGDIQQIIAEHHERPDGSGFPLGITSSKISLLSAVFIIAEDLAEFLGSKFEQQKIQQFLALREEMYNRGNFRKAFMVLKESIPG